MRKPRADKSKRTRRGVYLNIQDSRYVSEQFGIQFYFSSMTLLERFERDLEKNRAFYLMNDHAKTKISILSCIFADIFLYRKIETRGFRVVEDGQEHLEVESIISIVSKKIYETYEQLKTS